MNNFELFKLKAAGLTNLNILNILDYQKTQDRKLSLRDMAVVSKSKNAVLFMEKYKTLDIKQLKEQYQRYPTVSIFDQNYPIELKHTYNPPVLLFYQGNIELLSKPKLAIVGARKCSEIGKQSVRKVVNELGNHFTIVSGLARGIDTCAHMEALKNKGNTIAVIGTGLDVYYPKENKALQDYMSKNHLVLSEYAPRVLVVEAKLRSGSLITCERAMEEGRDVFAIPGNILDGKSDGCHHLIQEGAKCITTGFDILSEFS